MKAFPQQKITDEQREELISLWWHGEMETLRKRQKELGVNRRYGQQRGNELGLRRPATSTNDYLDPRWQWAIERGPVLA